jgi:hypothetical protein
MKARFIKLLPLLVVLLASALLAFGEGEWEDSDNVPTDESDGEIEDNEPNGDVDSEDSEIETPEAEDLEDAEPVELPAQVQDTPQDIDEPALEPPADTFPIVHATEAAAPRPRNPGRILDSVEIDDLTVKLDADRLLLSEIRKDVPEAREEAELYLIRLKDLAEKSDPVRLVPLFDRVLDQAPIYFEWLETEYENQDDQITEYYVGGARGFAFAMENFRSAVFLVIMNRLDIASRVISELE